MAGQGQHKRLRVRLKARDPEGLARDFGVFLRDDGLFLPCREPLAPTTPVRVQLLYADGSLAVEGRGRVVRYDVRPTAGLELALAWDDDSKPLVQWCRARAETLTAETSVPRLEGEPIVEPTKTVDTQALVADLLGPELGSSPPPGPQSIPFARPSDADGPVTRPMVDPSQPAVVPDRPVEVASGASGKPTGAARWFDDDEPLAEDTPPPGYRPPLAADVPDDEPISTSDLLPTDQLTARRGADQLTARRRADHLTARRGADHQPWLPEPVISVPEAVPESPALMMLIEPGEASVVSRRGSIATSADAASHEGTPPAGAPPAGAPPAGAPPAGALPAGTPPAGTPPAGAPAQFVRQSAPLPDGAREVSAAKDWVAESKVVGSSPGPAAREERGDWGDQGSSPWGRSSFRSSSYRTPEPYEWDDDSPVPPEMADAPGPDEWPRSQPKARPIDPVLAAEASRVLAGAKAQATGDLEDDLELISDELIEPLDEDEEVTVVEPRPDLLQARLKAGLRAARARRWPSRPSKRLRPRSPGSTTIRRSTSRSIRQTSVPRSSVCPSSKAPSTIRSTRCLNGLRSSPWLRPTPKI